jgi:hypothetical protein
LIIFCESCDDFNSKEYTGYKPYTKPERGYDWREYVRLNDDEDGVECCHMCDIRKTGCTSKTTPRYYCKKDRRSIQTKLILGEY